MIFASNFILSFLKKATQINADKLTRIDADVNMEINAD